MRDQQTPDEATRSFVNELLDVASFVAQVLDHMHAYPHSAPDAPPPHVVLANLLCDVVGPELARDPDGIRAAADAMQRVGVAMSEEIYIVPAEIPFDDDEPGIATNGDSELLH